MHDQTKVSTVQTLSLILRGVIMVQTNIDLLNEAKTKSEDDIDHFSEHSSDCITVSNASHETMGSIGCVMEYYNTRHKNGL